MKLAWLVAAGMMLAGCRSEAHEAMGKGMAARPMPATREAAPLARPWSCGAVHENPLVRRAGLGVRGQPALVGVVADAKEPLPETLTNLRRFAAAFRQARVDAVLVLGGMGDRADAITRTLEALRPAGAPLFALPGDREPEAAFHDGVAQAKAAGMDVTDLAKVRVVEGDGLVLVSLPGYPFRESLGAGDSACHYQPADVDALVALMRGLHQSPTVPIVFAAHTPPRGHGPTAIDWALGGANVGDPDLARILPALHVTGGVFAHVDEAGGRGSDGSAPVPEQTWAAPLYVNVGGADSVPHDLVGGGRGLGQAALVEFRDGKARFRVVR